MISRLAREDRWEGVSSLEVVGKHLEEGAKT